MNNVLIFGIQTTKQVYLESTKVMPLDILVPQFETHTTLH